MGILQRIGRVVDKVLDRLIVSFANVLLFAMTVAVFVEVISRYAFGSAHGQTQEYCIFAFVWIVFIMAGKVTKEKKHIIIGLLPERLVRTGKVRAKAALDIYISITLLVFAVMFLYFGVLDTGVYKMSGYHSTLDYVPQYWIRHLALPVGAALLIYYGVKELIQNLRSMSQLNYRGRIKL